MNDADGGGCDEDRDADVDIGEHGACACFFFRRASQTPMDMDDVGASPIRKCATSAIKTSMGCVPCRPRNNCMQVIPLATIQKRDFVPHLGTSTYM